MKTAMPRWLTVLILLAAAAFWWVDSSELARPGINDTSVANRVETGSSSVNVSAGFLPREALRTVDRIIAGGPHPYPQDGTVFFNREALLPDRARGHYREFTVDTPGLDHRGARRIVTGGNPPRHWYYTDDHYQSFRAFEVTSP
ncbi:ribonuclease domain-containing protein [Polycyclovorans algicola]|uniref:ribonuclease domain-containing protein n=1 Tax=Polycyclovorans algicola TaxID=616992 RepID=UPI0004A71D98|nr:ribonuclease domain-containing protein [Polycyclovorans algicola]